MRNRKDSVYSFHGIQTIARNAFLNVLSLLLHFLCASLVVLKRENVLNLTFLKIAINMHIGFTFKSHPQSVVLLLITC